MMAFNLWLTVFVACSLINQFYALDDRIHFEGQAIESSGNEQSDIINKREIQREDDGYCVYEIMKQKLVAVPVPYTEKETYYGRCRGYYFKKCLNERYVAKTRIEHQVKNYTETVRSCCDGYAELVVKKCLPICDHGCVFGNCTAPNECTCYEGYEKSNSSANTCKPACVGCTHGTCKAPNICFCNAGYNWDSENTECVPVCSEDCINGRCIAPEQCDCNDGYVHHPTHSICIPHCNEPCVHGQCVGKNRCECDFEHQFANGSESICEPICEISCKNAKCVEPNTCECHNGYTVRDDAKPHECHCGMYCIEIDGMCHCLDEGQRVSGERIRNNISSICSESNCLNGVCMTPDLCECYDGFEKNEYDICVAANETCIDDPENCNGTDPHACNCINGICSANRTCICVNGFKMSEGHTDLCEPHCTKECVHGFCINPDSCECDNGYRLGYNESESYICHPICDSEAEDNNGCINGTCIAPDTCKCFDGFELDLHANYTCIPIPYDASSMARSRSHWLLTGVTSIVILITVLAAAAFFINKHRNRKFHVPKQDDEANEPITAYLQEDI